MCLQVRRDPRLELVGSNLEITAIGQKPYNENSSYVFPEKELRGLGPNFHIQVSVSDLYIPKIGPHIFLQQNRQTDPGNI